MRQLQILFNFSQNLTSNCLLISVFLTVFTTFCMMWSQNCFVLICRTILWSHHAKIGKNTEIHKQFNVNSWLDWRKYGTVSYSFSCTFIIHIRFPNKSIWEGIQNLSQNKLGNVHWNRRCIRNDTLPWK